MDAVAREAEGAMRRKPAALGEEPVCALFLQGRDWHRVADRLAQIEQ